MSKQCLVNSGILSHTSFTFKNICICFDRNLKQLSLIASWLSGGKLKTCWSALFLNIKCFKWFLSEKIRLSLSKTHVHIGNVWSLKWNQYQDTFPCHVHDCNQLQQLFENYCFRNKKEGFKIQYHVRDLFRGSKQQHFFSLKTLIRVFVILSVELF